MKTFLDEIHAKIAYRYGVALEVVEAIHLEWEKDYTKGFTDLNFVTYFERNLIQKKG